MNLKLKLVFQKREFWLLMNQELKEIKEILDGIIKLILFSQMIFLKQEELELIKEINFY